MIYGNKIILKSKIRNEIRRICVSVYVRVRLVDIFDVYFVQKYVEVLQNAKLLFSLDSPKHCTTLPHDQNYHLESHMFFGS